MHVPHCLFEKVLFTHNVTSSMKSIDSNCLLTQIGMVLMCSVFLICCDSNPTEMGPRILETGTWGSEETRLDVEATGATITFFCAEGTVDGMIEVNQDDEFDATGTMISGPVAGPARPVRYLGDIIGDLMTLSIAFTDSIGGDMGTYQLTRGLNSDVSYLCRC